MCLLAVALTDPCRYALKKNIYIRFQLTPRFELDINKVGFWWQRRFYEFTKLDLHDPRIINWVWDVDGDKGKTLFIKWFILHVIGAVLLDITNYKDMLASRTCFVIWLRPYDSNRHPPCRMHPGSRWNSLGWSWPRPCITYRQVEKKKHLFSLALYPLKGFSLHLGRGE